MGAQAAHGLDLAAAVRDARLASGLQQVEVARRAGITPSYLSRIEGAAWNNGGPWPSDRVLRSLARTLSLSPTELITMRTRARRLATGRDDRPTPGSWLRPRSGTRYVTERDDGGVYRAAAELVSRNPRQGSLRATTIVPATGPPVTSDAREEYVRALRRKLEDDSCTTYLRVATATGASFGGVRHMAQELPVGVGNVRTRFCFVNPLSADVLIGENEALIAIPADHNRPDLRACVVVDDPGFVRALREWYDEFVWEPAGECVELPADRVDQVLDEVEARLGPTPPG